MEECNRTLDRLRSFVVRQCPKARKIGFDDLLLESGILDSLGVLSMVTYIETEFGITVLDEDLVPENFQTLEHIEAYVRRKSNGATE